MSARSLDLQHLPVLQRLLAADHHTGVPRQVYRHAATLDEAVDGVESRGRPLGQEDATATVPLDDECGRKLEFARLHEDAPRAARSRSRIREPQARVLGAADGVDRGGQL